MQRRRLAGSLTCGAIAISYSLPGSALAESKSIEVWKSPTCGCCKDWIKHLQDNGFSVTSFDEDGVRLDDGMVLGWDRIESARLSGQRQADFDRSLKELGDGLYRIRQRLRVGDYRDLQTHAEALTRGALLPHTAPASSTEVPLGIRPRNDTSVPGTTGRGHKPLGTRRGPGASHRRPHSLSAC